MLKKIYKNIHYILILFYIITPIEIMFINYFKLPNFVFWYMPNFIAMIVGLYEILINIKKYKRKEYILIGILILISIISSIFAKNTSNSFIGKNTCHDSFITFISYLGFFCCSTKLKDKNKLMVISKTFTITATILSILALTKLDIIYKFFLIPKDTYYFYKGPFSFFNQFGAYLLYASIISIFIFFYEKDSKKKILYFIINCILIFTLVLNDTFGAFLSFAGTLFLLIIYCIKYKKYILKVSIILLIFIISCLTASRDGFNLVKRNFSLLSDDFTAVESVNDKNISKEEKQNKINSIGTNRGALWINGVKYIIKKPIFGYGYENIVYEYNKDKIEGAKPHNRYLEIVQNTGIISLIIYVILVVLIIKKSIKNLKNISREKLASLFFIIAYLSNAVFAITFFNTNAYFYIALGILAQYYYKGEKYAK